MSCKGGCGQMPNTVMLKLEALKIAGHVEGAKEGYKFLVSGMKAADINAHKGQTAEARKAFLASPVDPKIPDYVWSQYLMDERVVAVHGQLSTLLAFIGLKPRMTATELGEWIRNGGA